MAEFLNPVPAVEDLLHVFEEGAREGGLQLDADLCGAIVQGLREAASSVATIVDFARAHGLVHALVEHEVAPLTPTARRQLARLAVPLDPEGRVMRLPTAAGVPVRQGGSAA
ncbi:hypothetical protein [Methylobacterium iners]|uniref:Uncharacterized protein n=1 Tax=Methylobacterium iners TaxID=418707 RepID=A0ABQ4RRJ0_9HYPH|nr:hypothetical protein [Methylobacterium iners]GJD93398.1 hypothetical protein OCOJLMKI_0592 [Methylobacterium iners]